MAANPTPTQDDHLMAAMMDLARVCAEQDAALGLKINTGAAVRAALETAQEAQMEVGRLKAELTQRRQELSAADKGAKHTLSHCRLRLVKFYGPSFNSQWDAAGFPDRSTQVPESQAKRAALLSQLRLWLESNPTLESADMQATAADCEAAHQAYRAARIAATQAQGALRAAVEAKDAAMERLRSRYRSVVRELYILLEADDPRWHLFGLKMPAQPTAPAPVPAAQAQPLPAGGWHLTWRPARHARRYRVQARHPGETEFQNLATVRGLELTLPELELVPGLELQIISANPLSEAAPCRVSLPELPERG